MLVDIAATKFAYLMINPFRFLLLLIMTFYFTGCKTTSESDFPPDYVITVHPLINQIWSVKEQRFISEQALRSSLSGYDYILLGESHDNHRHHQLQGSFIKSMIDAGEKPAVAFEMLDKTQNNAITEFQNQPNQNLDAFARAVDWQKSGWPDWPWYRPVFKPVIEQRLPIFAANLDTKTVRSLVKEGSSILDKQTRTQLEQLQFGSEVQEKLEQEINSAHCELLPENLLSPMLMAQQVRDITMMQTLLAARLQYQQPVILIAGTGHTRNDYGVPWYLRQLAPDTSSISIAFVEVRAGQVQPGDYARHWNFGSTSTAILNSLPFDYVWFTETIKREDPCEQFKAHMKKKAQ
jgi:uncharacterized iron-regulated protein